MLLILAAVTINLTLGENGIFRVAQQAAKETKKASKNEETALSRYEFEMAKVLGNVNGTETFGEYSIEKEIKEKYGHDIKIGDTVNYEDGVEEYKGTWKVLGIENGQMLLMSSDPVSTVTLKGKNGFLNLETTLNEECKEYGNGEGAESVRSLKIEDINKIADYNPENPVKVDKTGKGFVSEYGAKVTFKLNEDGKLEYECSNGQSLTTDATSFEYVDGSKLGNGNSTISIANSGYNYVYGPDGYETSTLNYSYHTPVSDRIENLFGSVSLRRLTGTDSGIALANTAVNANTKVTNENHFGAYFTFFQLTLGWNKIDQVSVGTRRLFTSDGNETENTRLVLAVVKLKPNVALTEDESGTWNLDG